MAGGKGAHARHAVILRAGAGGNWRWRRFRQLPGAPVEVLFGALDDLLIAGELETPARIRAGGGAAGAWAPAVGAWAPAVDMAATTQNVMAIVSLRFN